MHRLSRLSHRIQIDSSRKERDQLFMAVGVCLNLPQWIRCISRTRAIRHCNDVIRCRNHRTMNNDVIEMVYYIKYENETKTTKWKMETSCMDSEEQKRTAKDKLEEKVKGQLS